MSRFPELYLVFRKLSGYHWLALVSAHLNLMRLQLFRYKTAVIFDNQMIFCQMSLFLRNDTIRSLIIYKMEIKRELHTNPD